jgi:hypothetical protein
MKPIEIAEQYETTHFDGDASLGQSETKDGVDIDKQGPSNPASAARTSESQGGEGLGECEAVTRPPVIFIC